MKRYWSVLNLEQYLPVDTKAVVLLVGIKDLGVGDCVIIKGTPNATPTQTTEVHKMSDQPKLEPDKIIIPTSETRYVYWRTKKGSGFPKFFLEGFFT